MPIRCKISAILGFMKSLQVDLKQFIRGITRDDVSHTPLKQRQLLSLLYSALQDDEVKKALQQVAASQGKKEIDHELDALIGKPGFGRWKASQDMQTIDFDQAFSAIERHAPKWLVLYERITRNRFSSESFEQRIAKPSFRKELFFVTAVVLRHRSRTNANYLPRLLGLLLTGCGVNCTVVEIFAGAGVCDTYKPLNASWKDVAQRARQTVHGMARNPQCIIAYDNLNFLNTIRDHALGSSRARFINVTTGLVVICPSLPPAGLQQSMFNPRHKLNIKTIVTCAGLRHDETARQISRFFIAEALSSVFSDAISKIFNQRPCSKPCFPFIRIIPPSKATTVFPLAGIFSNEGTIDETYDVHDNIFLRQFGFTLDDRDEFNDKLWIVWGDQKTAEFNRSVKFEQRLSRHPYHRRQWLLSPPAYFHIAQAILFLIVRTHFENPRGAESKSTLLHDIRYWARTRINRENIKYHDVRPLVKDGFNSRILAVFYDRLQLRGKLHFSGALSVRRKEDVETALKTVTAEELLEIIEDIRNLLFTPRAWTGSPEDDAEYTTFSRYIQSVEMFMSFDHAITHGDVGMIERIIHALPAWFYGADQCKYGAEMLHFCWLLGASSPELREALLCSGLVNQKGRTTAWKAIDLAVEHLNCEISLDMKYNKNSTHDIKATFARVTEGSVFMMELRQKLQRFFSRRTNDRHTRKNVQNDLFSLSCFLQAEWPCWNNTKPTIKRFICPDALANGLRAMDEKVAQLNDSVSKGRSMREAGSVSMFTDTPDEAVETALELAENAENSPNADIDDYDNYIDWDEVLQGE